MSPLPEPNRPDAVGIVAFGGWGDAGDAATSVPDHLLASYPSEDLLTLSSETYYDYQVTRPESVIIDASAPQERQILWPSMSFGRATVEGRPIITLTGPEPNLRWKQLCEVVGHKFAELGVRRVIVLGALITNTPHSRPFPVSATPLDAEEAARLGVEISDYEGPTGITGALTSMLSSHGFDVTSLWVALPHYVSDAPQPKATLALARRVEALVDLGADWSSFESDAVAWERGVDELVESDEDIAAYVRALETEKDASAEPEASGEAIAAEFERFLRRRDDT